jgi:hypothetical protein
MLFVYIKHIYDAYALLRRPIRGTTLPQSSAGHGYSHRVKAASIGSIVAPASVPICFVQFFVFVCCALVVLVR